MAMWLARCWTYRTATPLKKWSAFRARSKKLHPDLGGDPPTFRALQKARDSLLGRTSPDSEGETSGDKDKGLFSKAGS
jgi:hypothetical protein